MDVIWLRGRLSPFNTDAAATHSFVQQSKHLRPIALVCLTGGGIGLGPAGGSLSSLIALFAPLALLVADYLVGDGSDVETAQQQNKKKRR